MKALAKVAPIVGIAFTCVALLAGCQADTPSPKLGADTYSVTNKVPHDPASFTQGLEVVGDDLMAESGGEYGRSHVSTYRITTGEPVSTAKLPDREFAEGLTRVDDKLIQLTWKSHVAHVWSADSLSEVTQYAYSGEGWGLCYDKRHDIMWRSDGSSTITGHSPKDFAEVSSFTVDRHRINELECIDGRVWANVWHSNDIIVIDPDTKAIIKTYDMTPLVRQAEADNGRRFSSEQVLNGIAHDAKTGVFYLTGKEWKWTYEVRFKETK